VPRIDLTDRFVAAAKRGSTAQTDYFDSQQNSRGLALRVSASHKAWTFTFTSPKDGKRARMNLGSYPALSLAKARGLAMEAKGHVEDERDPRDVLAAKDAAAMTVEGLVESYLEKHARPNLRSAAKMEARFDANVTPIIGAIKIAELHRRDVNRVLDAILARQKPTMARIVFQDMRAMLRWAVGRGDLDHNPMEGTISPSSEKPRERVLTNEEIATVWNGLPASLAKSKACQRIIKLCLVTAQRVGEVSGMRIDELDLVKGTWTLPGARTKNGHPHTVPLSDMAVDLIKEAIEAAGKSPFVFPAGEECPLPPMAMARTIGRAQEATEKRPKGRFGIDHFTAHDLRRTALTGMAGLGVAPVVLGYVANHRTVTNGGITMAVYNQFDYAREKRQALELWADRLASIVDGIGATIIPMKARADG
jgi:integrase